MLSTVSLFSSVVGTLLVIAPTFNTISRLITDTETIDRLEFGRKTILHFNEIDRQDSEFEPVFQILKRELDSIDTPQVEAIYPRPFGMFGGGGGRVYFLTPAQADRDSPFSDDEWPEMAESILIIDEWLSDEIDYLQTHPKQLVRGGGFLLIVVSIISQSVVFYLQNPITF